ncbi:tyrosine-type recombinase/integrase [Lacipirellula sp.]|uniref:tyrosine-type recombinase/integrase n=1 Tax=Lacipirellula sp. TaxID=2691419 RepID=UPI003D1470A6
MTTGDSEQSLEFVATLHTEVTEYYEHIYRPDKHALPKSHTTRDSFRTELRTFNAALRFRLADEGKKLRNAAMLDLTDWMLKAAMTYQVDRGRAVPTANKLYRTLCAIWRDAFDRGLMAAPPRTKAFKEPKREPQCWSLAEYERILDAADRLQGWVGAVEAKIFFAAYLWCTYSVGSRQGVTLAIPSDDFDAVRGDLLLPADEQKQNADQRVELLPEAVKAISRLRSQERGLKLLFGDWRGHITNFNMRLRKIIVAAGLRHNVDEVTRWDLSHRIRRTFATHACANSDEETVRQLLGHSHISVTRRYLDKRYLPRVSARNVVPPLRQPTPDPPPPTPPPVQPAEMPLRVWHPEAS